MTQSTLVPVEHIAAVWPLVAPYLERAIDHGGGRYALEDIYALVATGKGNLWVAYEADEVCGVAITQVMQYPRLKALLILSVAGKNMKNWFDQMELLLRRWAADSDCAIIEAYGRIGWEKHGPAAGYNKQFQVYQRGV